MISTLIDFILHIDQHLVHLSAQYGPWIYAILFVVIFCETGLVVTPFLPGDSLLFAAGGIAAIGDMNIHVMVLLLLAAAILGDAANFMIGKYFGQKLFANPDSKIFRRSYLEKTHAFYEKHGGKTIIIARFVPIVRTFAPFVAGMGDMHYGTPPTVVGFFLLLAFGKRSAIGKLLLQFDITLVFTWKATVMAAIIVISILPAVVEVIRAKLNAKK